MNKTAAVPPFWAFAICLLASIYVHFFVPATWVEQKTTIQVFVNDQDQYYFLQEEEEILIDEIVPYEDSPLRQQALDQVRENPTLESQWVVEQDATTGELQYSILQASQHFRGWSLLPAFVAICLCLLTREPLPSRFAGMVVGAFMLGSFNLLDEILVPTFASSNSAGILLLYLWLLGGYWEFGQNRSCTAVAGFMHVCTRTEVSQVHCLATWIGFPGGSSTVLAGVAIKPLADKSHVVRQAI